MLCLADDVDHNNSKGMQTKVYEYNFTNNCNKTQPQNKIVQLIQQQKPNLVPLQAPPSRSSSMNRK